ncbi:GRAS family transcription factor [Dorcoceras hygrometricum]|uniref:GRAS family transcription factor n=1 Tax=Dorcoceras hygrometricum TaxID=472368 RepID=A0A2Z7DEK6_9LAMI|nr:GRAS family transcription factor [Dorcoceras hygrometricum]
MMDGWNSFPTLGYLNHDSAIRRFCPARVEEEQGEEWGGIPPDEEMDMWPCCMDGTLELPPTEAEEIVDTFFNVECFERENANKSSDEENGYSGLFQEENPLQFNILDDFCYEPDIPLMVEEDETKEFGLFVPGESAGYEMTNGVDQGLQLVHLLLACAEALGCRDTRLANSILTRLWPCVNPWGDSLQRVSHYFAKGLDSRLSFLQMVNPNVSFTSIVGELSLITREEKCDAFSLLHQMTPYIGFGFLAANDAIYQAAMGIDSLHIVDLGMEHNLQWPSLVRILASRSEGGPKFIRITGIIGDQDPMGLDKSMKGLCEEANSLGICLEYHLLAEQVSPLLLTRKSLELRGGEALFVNAIMHLHKHVKESRGSLKTILQSIKKLNPTLLTVVEQDANHNGPFFLGRFLESLHYYSAIFDSLEATHPRNSPQRIVIESFHFAEEIRNIVACEGSNRMERHERADQWRRQLGRAGFQVVGLKCLNKAQEMVSNYGYRVKYSSYRVKNFRSEGIRFDSEATVTDSVILIQKGVYRIVTLLASRRLAPTSFTRKPALQTVGGGRSSIRSTTGNTIPRGGAADSMLWRLGTCVTLNGSGIQLVVGPQQLWLRNHNFGLAQRIMVKRLATSPHDLLGITDSACKNQLVMVSVQYGPFNTYIPIRSTIIGKSRVAKDPIAMNTSWRSNSDIASVTSIGYPRMKASGESSTTKHQLLHASGPHPIPPPNDPNTCVTLNGSGIQLAVDPQPLWLRNHNFGLAQRIMVKRLATSPHDPLDSIGYPRMKASGESSTTKHQLLHASGPHPIPPPNDPKVSMTFRVVRTNRYNQDLGLFHSTNGNHLESPNEGSSIDHQVTIHLHAQNITMFPTNETWYFASQMLVSSSGGLILILTAQSTRNVFRIHSDY